MVDPAVHTGASGAKIRPQARVQKHNYHNCQNYRPKPLKTVKFWVKTGPLSGAKILGLPTSGQDSEQTGLAALGRTVMPTNHGRV